MGDPADEPAAADLLARARGGDREALSALLERNRERLLGRIRLMLGDGARRHAESVDFLQGLFVQIVEAIETADLDDERGFLRWATRIARNDVRDEGRRRRERALESLSQGASALPGEGASTTSPPARAERADDVERLVEALEELRPEDRTVVELRDLDGLSYREIAERMQKPSEAAAQMHHARAVARLARKLDHGR
jgi:RNA polymerase sigma-70 factor (ECF subfamily)